MPRALPRNPGLHFVALALGIGIGACGIGQLGATEVNLAQARSSAQPGADLFTKECAGCHGERGEGTGRGPAIMGAGALPVFPSDQDRATKSQFSDPDTLEEEARARPAGAPSRDPFRNAQDLFTYVSTRMPRGDGRAGTLEATDYWAVINFVLRAHGSAVPEGGVNAGNAATVEIAP